MPALASLGGTRKAVNKMATLGVIYGAESSDPTTRRAPPGQGKVSSHLRC